MRIERLAKRDRRVVVPREKLARDHFVDADLLHPEVDRRVELSFDQLLPDDRHHHARGGSVLLPQLERRLDVADHVVPPLLRIARRSAVWRPDLGVGFGIAGVHREFDQVDVGLDHAHELLAEFRHAARTCCRWCSSRRARPFPWRTRSCPPCADGASVRRRRCTAATRCAVRLQSRSFSTARPETGRPCARGRTFESRSCRRCKGNSGSRSCRGR